MQHHDYNKQIILDSNVWIGHLMVNDTLHLRATELMEDLGGIVVVVPEYVLLEVVTILKVYKKYKEAEIFSKRVLSNNAMYLPSSGLARLTADVCFVSKYKKLSFIDTALLVLSKDYEIITFDKDLQKAIDAKS